MHHIDIAHMIISSLVHGLVYAAIFKALHNLSLASAAIVAVIGIALVWLVSSLTRRR
ncbi:MAG: hypothetical protein KGL42_00410 [Betaproteobacteria bacterium]|nr:hypothetical protein [Betaproteobacteria bacterium]